MKVLFLENIRVSNNNLTYRTQIFNTGCILLFGIIMGAFSKFLDCTSSNHLPYLFETLDVSNFLGRFAIWIFLAVCISIFSVSPVRAAINVFVFFAGMVVSYYLYSKFIAGFFPKSYALIWVGFTMVSPVLAFICWYAKGDGIIAIGISSGIIAVLFNTAFGYGAWYFHMRYLLECIVLIAGILLLLRSGKETFLMLGCGIIMAVIFNFAVPYRFW